MAKNQLPERGINRETMKCFLNRYSSYSVLEDIFYGLNNVKIPNKMWEQLNTSEGLAIYCSTGEAKMGRAKPKDFKYDGSVPLDQSWFFSNLVSRMVNEAYSRSRELNTTFPKRGFNEHSIKKGALIERMQTLPGGIQTEFLESLAQQRKYSNKQGGYDFYDPNCDGHSKKVYVNAISHRFEIN